MSRVDGDKAVDREPEAAVLEQMLRFETGRRVLIVSDSPGQGKSVLLRKLRWLCDLRFEVPAALVPLEEYEQRPDELALATDIVDQLAAIVPFDEFNRLASARSLRESGSFERQFNLQGHVLATNAQVADGGTVAGTIIQHASINMADWEGPSEREARRQCLAAFHAELVAHSAEQPVVIIFDTLDKSPEVLRRWVFRQLLKAAILDRNDEHKLVVVVAGVGLHEMLQSIFAETFETCFEPISSLGSWGRVELEQFLDVHGCGGLSADDVEMLLANRVQFGKSLQVVLEMAHLLLRDRTRHDR